MIHSASLFAHHSFWLLPVVFFVVIEGTLFILLPRDPGLALILKYSSLFKHFAQGLR